MNRNRFAQVQSDGSLIIPADIVERFGLTPGTKSVLIESDNRLILRRPISSLTRVYVEPTNLCNLTCTTCMRNVWEEPLGRMSEPIFSCLLDSLQAISPCPTIFFGGLGEPLFHPQIIQMIHQVKKLGCRAELITNGILLTPETANQLIQAKLDMLWISIDGATPSSYLDVRLGDSLSQILENVKNLRSQRDQIYAHTPQLGFAFVAMRRNINDLPQIIRLGLNLGVKRFSITNVLAHTPELRTEILYEQAQYKGAYLNSDVLPHISLPRLDLNDLTQTALFDVLRNNYQISLMDHELPQTTDTCPFVERGSLAIRWDGMVSPCLPLLHTHDSFLDDRVRRSKAYAVGSIQEQNLNNLWNDPIYISLRETLQGFVFSPCVFCNSCELANDNQEDCFGNILPSCGGCLWAQGLIQCP